MDIDQKRIVFTGNIARFNPLKPGRPSQIENIKWLAHIVAPHLRLLTDRPIESVQWDLNADPSHDLYRYLQLDTSIQSYLDIYTGRHNEALESMLLPLFSDSLVIGFELPPFLISLFNKHAIPYIDVILGPIRYFPDLVPALRSNIPSVAQVLATNRLPENELKLVASWRQAFFAKQPAKPFAENTLLLVGQTRYDTSQLREGKFVDLLDFEDELAALVQGRSACFKPHPLAAKNDQTSQAALMRKLNVPLVEDNIYFLLNCRGVDEVATISSSVAQEAPWFGLGSRTLIDYPFPFADAGQVELDHFYNICDQLASTEFWAQLLGAGSQEQYALPLGSLAQSMGYNWGAAAFSPQAKKAPATLLARLLGR